jgi:hypothetical protein
MYVRFVGARLSDSRPASKGALAGASEVCALRAIPAACFAAKAELRSSIIAELMP